MLFKHIAKALEGMPKIVEAYIILNWVRFDLEGQSYFFFSKIFSSKSDRVAMSCGVPQGSMLGPLPLNLYTLACIRSLRVK